MTWVLPIFSILFGGLYWFDDSVFVLLIVVWVPSYFIHHTMLCGNAAVSFFVAKSM